MTRKALAYTSDIIVGRTGEVISRAEQKERICSFAAENDIEIVCWYEDQAYVEDPFARSGLRQLLAWDGACDCVLVERTWCLTRQWPELRRIIEKLANRKVRLEAATTLWDCVSQMARQYYRQGVAKSKVVCPIVETNEQPARVRRPARLNFVGLTRATNHA